MPKYKFPSIRESGGLQPWINKGRSAQNGRGYDEFVVLVGENVDKPVTPKAAIARAFNRDRQTIESWLQELRRERDGR